MRFSFDSHITINISFVSANWVQRYFCFFDSPDYLVGSGLPVFHFFLLHIDFRIRFGWVGPEKLLFGKEDLGIDLGEAGWDLLCIAFGLRRGWVGLGIGRFSTLVLVGGDLHAYILHGRMHAVCEIEREDLSTWGETHSRLSRNNFTRNLPGRKLPDVFYKRTLVHSSFLRCSLFSLYD